jgi:hypothetical protein
MKVGVMGGLFKDWGNVMGKKVWGWKDVGGASVFTSLMAFFPIL